MTRPSDDDLLVAATEAMERAYAPYSKFHVGAALLTHDGAIVTGVNVENASYGLTICAERTALFTAVSQGIRAVEAIAIVSSGGEATWPCGACRQVLYEFTPTLRVITRAKNALLLTQTLTQLLPHAFGPCNLTDL